MPVHETVFMFSAPGPRYSHVGKSLFATDDSFRSRMQRLDAFMRTIERRPGLSPLACRKQTVMLRERPEAFFRDVARQPIRFRETVAASEQAGPCRCIDSDRAGTQAVLAAVAY